MSGGGWKEPLYKIVQNDSRNAAWLGNAIGWQGLEDEAKYNTKNPGHAVGKAAQYAATYYLASLLGGGDAAGNTGSAAAPAVADESAGLIGAGTTAAEAAQQQAAAQALAQAAKEAPQGFANTVEAGMQNTGYTPSSLWNALSHANSANGTSLQQNLLNYGKQAATNVQNGSTLNGLMSGSASGKGGLLAQQMGLRMMQPQQQPQMPMSPPPRQGNMEPLNNPYSSYGTPAGNSTGFTEEQKRKLRAMGYQV